jgi:hypothetical protein
VKLTAGSIQHGPAGTATEVHATVEPDDPPAQTGTVATWFLDCPGQSPAWRHYLLNVVHLRPIDGAPPAKIVVPHATHEFSVYALAPDARPQPTDTDTWRHLTPVNVCEQVQLTSDDGARRLARLAARAVVAGVLPAESALAGAREPWRSSLIRSSAHMRGETHSC